MAPAIVQAQDISGQRAYAVSNVSFTPQKTSPLDNHISVSFKNTSLEDTLRKVATLAGVRLAYAGPVVATQKSVTITRDHATAGAILHAILEGTGLRHRIAGDQVIIERARTEVAETGVVVGKITDAATGRPVVGAVLSVEGSDISVKTGNDGTFRLVVPAGDRVIRVRALGYVRETRRVSVTDDSSITVDVSLRESASVLDEVVVTGTVVATERKAITTPITVITADDIERRGITRIEQLFRGEIPSVFALEQGSEVYSDDLGAMQSSTVYTRGVSALSVSSGSSPLKTFVDGVEILDATMLGTLDPKSFERIEIITGPQAATIYGSGALGGVMQIFTKKGQAGQPIQGALIAKYGMLQSNMNHGRTPSHDYTATVSGGIGIELSYTGNLSYRYTGQWQPALFSRSVSGSVGATLQKQRFTVSATVSTTQGKNGTSIGGNLVHRVLGETGEWWQDNWPAAYHISQRVAGSRSHMGTLNVDFQLSPWSQHHLTIGRHLSDFYIEPMRPTYARTRDTLYQHETSSGQRTTVGYNTTLLGSIGSFGSTLTLGLNGSSASQVTASGCTTTPLITGWSGCSASSGTRVSSLVGSGSQGAFGSWRVSFFDQLYLTLGLRGERNPNYGQKHRVDWTPTNGLAYTMAIRDVTIKLLGSYGSATRAPSPEMRSDQWSTPSAFYNPSSYLQVRQNLYLRPEYSRGPQTGIEVYVGNIGSFTVNRYDQKVTDLIQAESVDSTLLTYSSGFQLWGLTRQYQNVAVVRQHGWEFTGSANFLGFTSRWTYSWNDSRVLQSRYYARGHTFTTVPTHTGSLTIGYAVRKTSISLTSNMVGRSLETLNNTWWYRDYSNTRINTYMAFHPQLAGRWNSRVARRGYIKSNLAVTHQISSMVTSTLHVTNLGNSFGSEVNPAYATLGRQTLLGISLRFPGRR